MNLSRVRSMYGVVILKPIDVVLIVLVLATLSGCQKPPPPTAVADEPAFRKPTATEVFNLRTRCAELASKISSEHDTTGSDIAAIQKKPPFLTQEQVSHYDPKTNRCYVELRVTVDLALLMALPNGNAQAAKMKNDVLKHFEPDYVERHLYDGQTGEELAYLQKGMIGVAPTGEIKGRLGKVEWFDAAAEMDNLMADDRKQ